MHLVPSAKLWVAQRDKALSRHDKLIKRQHLCLHERFYKQLNRLRDYENNR